MFSGTICGKEKEHSDFPKVKINMGAWLQK